MVLLSYHGFGMPTYSIHRKYTRDIMERLFPIIWFERNCFWLFFQLRRKGRCGENVGRVVRGDSLQECIPPSRLHFLEQPYRSCASIRIV